MKFNNEVININNPILITYSDKKDWWIIKSGDYKKTIARREFYKLTPEKRDLVIMSLSDYKRLRCYKKMANSVQVNMMGYNGFSIIGDGEPGYDERYNKFAETSLEYTKVWINTRQIKKGLVVYYRGKNGWSLPYIQVFQKDTFWE